MLVSFTDKVYTLHRTTCCNFGHLCEAQFHQFVNQLIHPRTRPSIAKTSLRLRYLHLSCLVHNSCYMFQTYHTSRVNEPNTVRKIVQIMNLSCHVMPLHFTRTQTASCYQTQSVLAQIFGLFRVQNTLIGASQYGNTLFHVYTSI